MRAFEILEHTADIGVRSYGCIMAEAFKNAAAGMFSLITDIRGVEPSSPEEVYIEAEDREELLVEWLNELLYKFEVEHKLFSRFDITMCCDEEARIRATIYGEPVDPNRHQIESQIKACTYYMLKVEKGEPSGIWSAQVIFDV